MKIPLVGPWKDLFSTSESQTIISVPKILKPQNSMWAPLLRNPGLGETTSSGDVVCWTRAALRAAFSSISRALSPIAHTTTPKGCRKTSKMAIGPIRQSNGCNRSCQKLCCLWNLQNMLIWAIFYHFFGGSSFTPKNGLSRPKIVVHARITLNHAPITLPFFGITYLFRAPNVSLWLKKGTVIRASLYWFQFEILRVNFYVFKGVPVNYKMGECLKIKSTIFPGSCTEELQSHPFCTHTP